MRTGLIRWGWVVGDEVGEVLRAGHADVVLSSGGCGCWVVSSGNRRILRGGLCNQIDVLERHFGKKVDSVGRVSDASAALPHTFHCASEEHSER